MILLLSLSIIFRSTDLFAIESSPIERSWNSMETRNEGKSFVKAPLGEILSVVIDRKPWIVSRLFPRMLVPLFVGASSNFSFFFNDRRKARWNVAFTSIRLLYPFTYKYFNNLFRKFFHYTTQLSRDVSLRNKILFLVSHSSV